MAYGTSVFYQGVRQTYDAVGLQESRINFRWYMSHTERTTTRPDIRLAPQLSVADSITQSQLELEKISTHGGDVGLIPTFCGLKVWQWTYGS